ncbi:GIY-YIG nuclease family protein [Streptomyces sp. NPDC002809]|uniref:GIY-YIG nuclease family protein n=1 Tax=Streptomyces sp. NPDC002809 TaxID=3154433 RepID=UPI0033318811
MTIPTKSTCVLEKCHVPPFSNDSPLCWQHAVQVYAEVSDVLQRAALTGAIDPTRPASPHEAAVVDDAVWNKSSHPAVVYFMVNGDRVKIGMSTNIAARTAALSLRRGNVILLLEGGYELEAALHRAFEADRVGVTEWFVLSVRIRDFIARKEGERPTRPQQPHSTAALPLPSQAVPPDRRHPRREEITQRVREAGDSGMTVSDLRRWLVSRYPDETPPSDTAMQNWFATHPNIMKPGRGIYVWSDTSDAAGKYREATVGRL